MNDAELLEGVRACVVEALEVEPAQVTPEARLVEDLGADSLDLLDLLFHLEQRFGTTLKPRSIERLARARIGGAELESGGVYTPEALAAIRDLLPEVPAAELSGTVRPAELPRRFRVRSFMELVRRAQAGEIPHG
jgi:acyl carrier protein